MDTAVPPAAAARPSILKQILEGAFNVTSNSIELYSESIEPAIVLEKGCRSRGSGYGGRSNVSGWAPRLPGRFRRKFAQGRRSDPKIPSGGRNSGDRSLAAIQRTCWRASDERPEFSLRHGTRTTRRRYAAVHF